MKCISYNLGEYTKITPEEYDKFILHLYKYLFIGTYYHQKLFKVQPQA